MTLKVRDIASYDYNDANSNGFKGYEIEHGKYSVYIGSNSHCYAEDNVIKLDFTIDKDILLKTDDKTDNEIINLFDDVSSYVKKYMSRSDFENTFPKSPTDNERKKEDSFISSLQYSAPEDNNKIKYKPEKNKIQLYQLREKNYNDPIWNEFINGLTVDEMRNLIGTCVRVNGYSENRKT